LRRRPLIEHVAGKDGGRRRHLHAVAREKEHGDIGFRASSGGSDVVAPGNKRAAHRLVVSIAMVAVGQPVDPFPFVRPWRQN
jgi:hypothetical protein